MNLDVSTFTPAERSTLQLRLLYEKAGYRKYRMARFEEYSLYQQYESFLPDAQVVTFTDLDGKLRAIRPDVTLSIAKNAQPAPGSCKKYFYTEQVCRPSRESHVFTEISQMGLECLGAVGGAEQAEVVRLAVHSLNALSDSNVLELGHMGFVTAWLDGVGVAKTDRPALIAMLQQKNPHGLRDAAKTAGLSDADAKELTDFLGLHGPLSATLSAARKCCRFEGQRTALEELTALQNDLGEDARGVCLDLSLAGDMEYYNGLVFTGYLSGAARAVLKGGQYDLLIRRFTPGARAIGFALYLDELDRLSAPLPRSVWGRAVPG